MRWRDVRFRSATANTAASQDQRKQNRQDEMAAFEFFNERRSDQKNGEHNEKLYRREPTESETLQHRVH